MNEKYTCYCGLYCENCAVRAKVNPAAKALYDEMKNAGFEEVLPFLPDGKSFWSFLGEIAENGACISCHEGGGNPACAIRICATEKGVEFCALCKSYPCENFSEFLSSHPTLKADNELLKNEGIAAWAELQDRRAAEIQS